MSIDDFYSHFHPILSYADEVRPLGGREFPSLIYGTAFALGAGLFLTAAHVIQNAASKGHAFLGHVPSSTLEVAKIQDQELFPGMDLALLSVPSASAYPIPWLDNRLPMLWDVLAGGYPYAADVAEKTIAARAFKGHIVSAPLLRECTDKPRGYELSFNCPRGLSGAPLLVAGPKVAGVIIASRISEIVVASDKEEVLDQPGKEITIYEKVERLHLGIAISSVPILALKSQLLSNTIGNYLRQQGQVTSSDSLPRS